MFFGMIFLLFALIGVAAFAAFAFDVDVCSFFVARELMRTRGVGCGNASGPTSGTQLRAREYSTCVTELLMKTLQ